MGVTAMLLLTTAMPLLNSLGATSTQLLNSMGSTTMQLINSPVI